MHARSDTQADLVIRARRVVLPRGIEAASVHIRNGIICGVAGWNAVDGARNIVDCGEDALLPGLVDLHAHINEPGRTEWEGFEYATRAAAAGGTTTVVDMPLNSIPPTVDSAALAKKIGAAEGRVWIDVGFHGGIVPGNDERLPQLLRDGVVGLKCFLCDSGVSEFPPVSLAQLRAAIERTARWDPWILVHAECPEVLQRARRELVSPAGWNYRTYLRSRPDEAECAAIHQLIELAETSAARIHIVHLSSAAALPMIARAKASGVSITAETCPHYLGFAAEEIAEGATELKCAPPIRSAPNREALWQGLRENVIDFIASDHSPCTAELKAPRDFSAAWGGISSLQCSLAAVWTEAQSRGFTLSDVGLWMSSRPAALAGLAAKGTIEVGKHADLVRFAPEDVFELKPDRILHRHKLTPYAGRRMRGVVRQTFLRGASVFDHGRCAEQPSGKIIRKAQVSR